MSWPGKSHSGAAPALSASKANDAAAPQPANTPLPNTRFSNGFKEFLYHLSDVKQGRLLDMGPVSASTINFLVNHGFGLATEDFLRSWRDFLKGEEERLRQLPPRMRHDEEEPDERPSIETFAQRFMAQAMLHHPEHFDGVLAWDVFDYLEPALLKRLLDRLYQILKPGGAILAVFHSRTSEQFHTYRILDHSTIELMPASPVAKQVRVFQNREILDLLAQFRSSKTFLGRDNLREALFVK